MVNNKEQESEKADIKQPELPDPRKLMEPAENDLSNFIRKSPSTNESKNWLWKLLNWLRKLFYIIFP